jgi:Flp pilus assembly protein TadG
MRTMRNDERHGWSGILGRLRRDKRGNALAIMAASLIPLMGFSGAAVDMARLYIVKVRLQQACDAGVLAGRKVMTDTAVSTPLDPAAKTQAATFFANNFRSGYLRSTAVDFKPVKAASGTDTTVANAVTGTASATVPMAVMGFFGSKPVKMDVTCQAVFDLADTDVMFVLDTTASMACRPEADCSPALKSEPRGDSIGSTRYYAEELSGSRIEALRKAVLLFDTTMRANADATTHFRYGFVTYASSVNVGGIIPAQYLQSTKWTYQSRSLAPITPAGVPNAASGDYAYQGASSFSYTGIPKASCANQRLPATGFTTNSGLWTSTDPEARSYYNLSWNSNNGGTCSGTQQRLRPLWRYGPVTFDTDKWIASLARESSAGAKVLNPTRFDGSSGNWRGCIEEVNTDAATSFDASNLPADLDPDTKPDDSKNKWRPQWPDVQWYRTAIAEQDVRDDQINENQSDQSGPAYSYNYGPGSYHAEKGFNACGMPAATLTTWTAQQVKNYVYNPEFKAFGGTYHDVGMIWGARMLSPDGIFASTTAAWPGRKEPSRNIVFMTDGDMSTNNRSGGLYGIERLDNRTGGAASTAQDTKNHTARFRAVCDAAKSKGYTIYVVAVGTDINADLTYCASPGQTFEASSTDELTDAFKQIAQRVAMLRITL